MNRIRVVRDECNIYKYDPCGNTFYFQQEGVENSSFLLYFLLSQLVVQFKILLVVAVTDSSGNSIHGATHLEISLCNWGWNNTNRGLTYTYRQRQFKLPTLIYDCFIEIRSELSSELVNIRFVRRKALT